MNFPINLIIFFVIVFVVTKTPCDIYFSFKIIKKFELHFNNNNNILFNCNRCFLLFNDSLKIKFKKF